MKQAYLVFAHKNPGQLRTLLSLLDDPRFDIYVHLDGRSGLRASDIKDCCSSAGLFFVDPVKVHWAGPSMIKAITRLIEAAIATPHSYYHLISGLDLPIKPADEIFTFFDNAHDTQFVEMWEMSAEEEEKLHHASLWPEANRLSLARQIKKLWAKLHRRERINEGITFRKAATWFSITEELAKYIVSEKDRTWEIFRRLETCDEQFVGSIVCWGGFESQISPLGNLRYVDWTAGGRHPKTLGMEDFAKLTESNAFWARKFDASVDSKVIDAMVNKVSGR